MFRFSVKVHLNFSLSSDRIRRREEFEMPSDNTSKFVWFFAGAAIGAAVALLYAPESGAQTRKLIGQKTGEGREALTESSKEIVERGRDLYEKGRKIADEAAEMFDRGRKLVQG
jgi:gas vesicle protein